MSNKWSSIILWKPWKVGATENLKFRRKRQVKSLQEKIWVNPFLANPIYVTPFLDKNRIHLVRHSNLIGIVWRRDESKVMYGAAVEKKSFCNNARSFMVFKMLQLLKKKSSLNSSRGVEAHIYLHSLDSTLLGLGWTGVVDAINHIIGKSLIRSTSSSSQSAIFSHLIIIKLEFQAKSMHCINIIKVDASVFNHIYRVNFPPTLTLSFFFFYS